MICHKHSHGFPGTDGVVPPYQLINSAFCFRSYHLVCGLSDDGFNVIEVHCFYGTGVEVVHSSLVKFYDGVLVLQI